jgi:glyoxylase-like metal-dependent hydrolase (beta-lactamase superfamily II)
MAFVFHAADAPVMVVGDALSNDPVAFSRPDWLWGADQDPEMGVATRRMLLDRLATEQMRFVGFHLPGGGMGRVERADGAYRYVPEG